VALKVKAIWPVVGLMTAVPMSQLVKDRAESGGIWIECFCTVGVSNAVRAGEPVRHAAAERLRRDQLGTINIILVTNATLAVPAMVGAVQVVSESKTATLIQKNVRSSLSRIHATGTGTDAVVIASSLAGRYREHYCGTHTVIGSMIGNLVARSVREGLERSSRWHKNTPS
jgi:adenosylcobinamide hydrolase